MKHKQDAIEFAETIIEKHIREGLTRDIAIIASLTTIEFVLDCVNSNSLFYSKYQRTYNYFVDVLHPISIENRRNFSNKNVL